MRFKWARQEGLPLLGGGSKYLQIFPLHKFENSSLPSPSNDGIKRSTHIFGIRFVCMQVLNFSFFSARCAWLRTSPTHANSMFGVIIHPPTRRHY